MASLSLVSPILGDGAVGGGTLEGPPSPDPSEPTVLCLFSTLVLDLFMLGLIPGCTGVWEFIFK